MLVENGAIRICDRELGVPNADLSLCLHHYETTRHQRENVVGEGRLR